ncbi:MAG: hypothetical protein AB1898_07350 [Acidobacteriota bacterium]
MPAFPQQRLPTDGPCADSMAYQAKGRWIRGTDLMSDLTLPFQKEANRRLDEIHRILEEIYPSPTGVDAVWHRAKGHILFAEDVTRVKGIPVGGYYYTAAFFAYICDPYSKNQMIAGYPGETGTFVTISANCFFPWGHGISDETWTIDGQPVTRRAPLKQMWKGYPLFHGERGSNTRAVLIHRKGTLPYIPVTRKQYLDHSIQHLTQIFDNLIIPLAGCPFAAWKNRKRKRSGLWRSMKEVLARTPRG